jgi:hypothetical protein
MITLELLAEKLKGKIWIKGDLKRVYLNEYGYNTKKMSTKAYIFEKDGEFIPVVNIECDSQTYQWIKSQKDEVKNRIEKEIENIKKYGDIYDLSEENN